ncbi:polysaccharide biosynthesis protein [Planococcus sp. SE5232]|uniref:polysaccharide biosynthesis protein n=1 Tax=unclassified Planococcus (in: firmicutes) TaxID=2662419 RepID=UPI003D6B260C
MKVHKQRLLGILHHSLPPFLVFFRQIRQFILVGFENIEEKLEDAVLLTAPHLTGKTVMVTGAGGRIGSEISRQLIQYQPDRILLLGDGPRSIYLVEHQLQKLLERNTEIIPIILNMQDKKRLFEAVRRHRPDIIYHTAGHQQIDITEEKYAEALYSDVYGIYNISEAANRYRISTFVLVSSEQAVKPRNLSEAAKRLTEIIVESIAVTSLTAYMIIRLPDKLDHRQHGGKPYHLFEQDASVIQAVQNVLHAGREREVLGSSNLIQQTDKNTGNGFSPQDRLSQIEVARLLKQLKTMPEEKAKELVISIIKN